MTHAFLRNFLNPSAVFLSRPIEFRRLSYAVGRVLIVAGSVWNSYNGLRSRGHSTVMIVGSDIWDAKSQFRLVELRPQLRVGNLA
jgi:hypothetical protein